MFEKRTSRLHHGIGMSIGMSGKWTTVSLEERKAAHHANVLGLNKSVLADDIKKKSSSAVPW